MVIANVFSSVCQGYLDATNCSTKSRVHPGSHSETTMAQKSCPGMVDMMLIWFFWSLKFHGLFQSKDYDYWAIQLEPPRVHPRHGFKVTSLIGSVGLLQRWVLIGDGEENLNAGRERQQNFGKAVFLFRKNLTVNVSEEPTKPAWHCFFPEKSPSAGKSDGWDECEWKGWRRESAFPSSKKMFCMLMSLIGAVMAMRLVWQLFSLPFHLDQSTCQTNPVPSHSGRWGVSRMCRSPHGSQRKTHHFGSRSMNWCTFCSLPSKV